MGGHQLRPESAVIRTVYNNAGNVQRHQESTGEENVIGLLNYLCPLVVY
jgi:hypothetical protein